MLGWTPAEFWRATPIEFRHALDGWKKAHGVEDETDQKAGPLTMDELRDLMGRFPDVD